jgi:hypothetical protein
MRRCERKVLLNIGKQSGQDDALDKWKSTDDRFHERIAAPHRTTAILTLTTKMLST